MRHRWTSFLLALAAVSLAAAPALAQDAGARTDSDPTKPVLFSLRPEFYRVDDGLWRAQVIARYDQAMLRNRRWAGGKRGILLRFELPVTAADTPSTSSSGGLGDAYAQFLLVPKRVSLPALHRVKNDFTVAACAAQYLRVYKEALNLRR